MKGSQSVNTSPGGSDWGDDILETVRQLIIKAEPQVVEEIKWRKPSNGMKGVPVWSKNGIICTGETYKDKVKLTFARGATLPDPQGLFNANDTGNTRRAIDIDRDYELNETAFMALIQVAAELNGQH